MEDDLYRALQRHLDRMPVPYPATESGVELSILRRLFSPDDARLALLLGMIPEALATIHRRAGRKTPRAALGAALDGMAERGLIQRVATKRGVLYGKAPLVIGFYESQVNRLTPEFQRDVERYGDEGFGAALAAQTPQLRTVPINEPIPFERAVGRYDDIRAFVRASPGPFAVMNCICQQGKDLLGQPCKQTHDREHCLTIGMAAESLAERGTARLITKDEMLGFLDRADREGLVVEPQNTQDPIFICCCCGCCCGVLTAAKKLPRPVVGLRHQLPCGRRRRRLQRVPRLRGAMPDGGHRLRRRHGGGEPGPLHRLRAVRHRVPDRGDQAGPEARRARSTEGHGAALRTDVPRAVRRARPGGSRCEEAHRRQDLAPPGSPRTPPVARLAA